ncbi:MAG TPA: phosphatidylserine decarboxylase family protein [Planctomycetaceae bacterium]|nr:phosphatidylserine decarboxylase family protein [Planctomycetaceae bacterium]
MDPQLTTIQPGGGIVMSIELGWGFVRRWYLRKFRPGYVERMGILRQGSRGSLPFEPVDQRDIKFYRNQETYWWPEADDDYRWRDSLPFARAGLAELILISGLCLFIAAALGLVWWPLCLPPLVVFGLVVWFFRNPPREIPTGHGVVVSPADGKLVEIVEIEDPDIGPAIRFGIFLSIFNVHINRSSMSGSVVAVRYRPGKFLNALRPESARENENLDVILSSSEMPGQYFRVRQITGQFARRIVCWVRPGDVLTRGEQFGMIKLGSRTELVIPRHDALKIEIAIGDTVSAGLTRLAHYRFDGPISGLDQNGMTDLQSFNAAPVRPATTSNRASREEPTDG